MNTTDTSAIQLAPITVDLTLAFGVGECWSGELADVDEHTLETAIERAQEAAYDLFRDKVAECAWMLDFYPMWEHAPEAITIHALLFEFTERDAFLWKHFGFIVVEVADVIRSFEYQEPVIKQIVKDIYREQADEERERGYRG